MKRYFKQKMITFGIIMLLLLCLLIAALMKKKENRAEDTTEIADVEEMPEEKAEEEASVLMDTGEKTVYVKADAKGNVKEVTLETLMEDEDGEQFRYKEDSSEALPVSVNISYYLDEEPIEPENLAGKSGKVRIRFDYENLEKMVIQEDSEETAPVPFAVITALALPADVFSDIEVTNGKVISVEGQSLVIGYALPGVAEYLELESYEPTEKLEIPEYVEVTADVKEFELEFTATVMTTGIFKDLENADLDEMEDMTDSMDELSDASKELVDGTGELYDGMTEFGGYLTKISEGSAALQEGAKALEDGLGTLNENKVSLKEGADALNDGLTELYQSLSAVQPLSAAQSEEAIFGETESQAGQELLATIESLELTDEQKAQLLAGIQGVVKEQMRKGLSKMQSSVGSLQAGSQALTDGMDALNSGIGQLYEGAKALEDGAETLTLGSAELDNGFSEVLSGVKSLKEGVEKFDREGIQELEKLAGQELRNVVQRLRVLRETDGTWNRFSGDPDKDVSLKIVLETESV